MIKDADLYIEFYRDYHSNPMIRVTHLPSGIVIPCDKSASAKDNQESAINEIQMILDRRESDGQTSSS